MTYNFKKQNFKKYSGYIDNNLLVAEPKHNYGCKIKEKGYIKCQ